MQEIDVANAFRLIEPGPVLLVTTCGTDGPNVMTMGFHMMVQHAPPLIGCVIGPWDHSYRALRETGECVLSVPRASMSATVTDIGNSSGVDIDKFCTFEIEAQPGITVKAPLLRDCIANLECRLADATLSNSYSLHILEVERLWVAPGWREAPMLHHIGDGYFRKDGDLIDESRRMTRWHHLAGL
ncbi:flavin reductase [Phyllobacterium phragmitis]|uniref:Flavin reductase n=1 Tax=Phyllobacterium phragmitis TaxID=2670329 RepID=A0A2S9IPY8_9HYPH|nr:flavin reductase family protein [Phyllobacterium phragmitis]PRD42598.1 flavin reductase [Phyllobacterium phragmitis]